MLVGSATARLGTIGVRYQCAWTGDQAGPANARLEVIRLDDQAGFDQYQRLTDTRAGDSTVRIGDTEVNVARQTDANGTLVFDAIQLVPEQLGAFHLLVEVTDPALRNRYQTRDAAVLLTDAVTLPVIFRPSSVVARRSWRWPSDVGV
jgi:hypothetical protein